MDSVAVDKCEDETSEISKVDKDFKTALNEEDVSGSSTNKELGIKTEVSSDETCPTVFVT